MKIYENVLTLKTLNRCLTEYNSVRSEGIWKNSSVFWDDKIRQGVLGTVIHGSVPEDLSKELDKELDKYFPSERKEYQYFVWNTLAALSTHDDAPYAWAATLYLNTEWDADCGGMLLWKDKREKEKHKWSAVCPTQNLLVLNDEHEDHLVTPIAFSAKEERVSIQIWGKPK